MRDKCGKCNRIIRDSEEVIREFGKEYHYYCCPHRQIKRNYPFGRKSGAMMYCLKCNKVINGKDLKEIRERKEREQRRSHRERR